MGCSGGKVNPLTPTNDLAGNAAINATQTHLWGYYDVYIDIPTQTATAVPNRGAMFSANVVQFVNSPVSNLSFLINGTPVDPAFVDVDIDVSITHPFSGLTMYNGYDVRGIFIGNGTPTLKYDTPDLKYAGHKGTTDQEMYDYALTTGDPGKYGNPDGYTRWFNPTEFGTTGLFGYTKGAVATPAYSGTATLNPYKYFADQLGVADNAYTFLTTSAGHGVFTAGVTNKRNYYLRFPNSVGIKFNYAIVANWKGEAPADHPANTPEACALSVKVTPDIWWTSATSKGGDLIVDMSFPKQWGATPSTIYIESTVLNNPYQLSTFEMTPIGGGAAFSTYHAEVAANNITGNSSTVNHEFWVIAQYNNYDYKNTFGVTNLAGDDKLAAFFRYDLYVSPIQYDKLPICDLVITSPTMPTGGLFGASVTFDASASTDPDPGETATLVFTWDLDGDGVYGETPDDDYTGTPDKPTYYYTAPFSGSAKVKVTDIKGGFSVCSVAVTVNKKTGKNILLRQDPGIQAWDVAADNTTGDLYIVYNDGSTWKYTRAGDYEDGVQWAPNNLTMGANIWNWKISRSPGGQTVVTGWSDANGGYGYNGLYGRVSYSDTGTVYATQQYTTVGPNTLYYQVPEACAFQADPFLNNNGMFYTKRDSAVQVSITCERATPGALPTPYGDGATNRHRSFTPDPMPVGPQYIGWKNIRGIEEGRTDTTLWILQGRSLTGELADSKYLASRFLISGGGFPGPFAYDFSSIGSGSQDNGDTGVYDPQDISRDNTNRIHILDLTVAGIPRIKVFNDPDPSSNPTSIGHYGDATTIDSVPRRIEGCEFDGWVYVLEGRLPAVQSNVFTGTGLNNCVAADSFRSDADHTYTVEVTGTGATFRWQRDAEAWSGDIGMLTYDTTLTDNVAVMFGTTSGHPVGDKWVISCKAGETSKLSCFFPSEMP